MEIKLILNILKKILIVSSSTFSFRNGVEAISNNKFPEEFKFGVATASYQIEGAWNEDGKGENIWDHICHTNPAFIDNNDNGDIACDSYHKWQDDVALIKALGVDFYRFSISWSRILPNGTIDKINQLGIDYYKNFLSELIANGIEPVVTIYHWDLPQVLQEIGGWTNPDIEDLFLNYARLCFEQFGDIVKTWISFNEPLQTCHQGYGDGTMAPGIKSSGQDEYICTHHLIKAHAKAWHLYDDEFRSKQNGRISITIDTPYFAPASNHPQDEQAAERSLQFTYGWYANAIYNKNYPQIMIDRISERSKNQLLSSSRLPEFSQYELDYISGTHDFMGVNVYTSYLTKHEEEERPYTEISFKSDVNTYNYQEDSWGKSASSWLKVAPWGLRKLLNWLKKTYNDPEIIITENGFSDRGEINDQGRIDYYTEYLNAVLEAIHEDGVNVTGYTAWSLMDNFEWARGYSEKFGLYKVDFNDPNRTRTPKASAKWYTGLVKTHRLVKN